MQVTIGDLAFSPDEITARVGDTVEWVNGDFIDHTATANNGKLGGDGHRGALSAVAAHEVGIFDYFCRFHPNITPKIHVSAD